MAAKRYLSHPLVLLAAALLVLWGIQFITKSVNDNLAALLVLPADPHPMALAPGQVSPNLTKLYPLTAHPPKSAAGNDGEVVDPNAAFVPVRKNVAPEVPDYFQTLQTNHLITLTALTDNGAILNGRFVAFGEPIQQFAYPLGNGPRTTAPRLLPAKKPATVTIQETPGKRSFTISQ